MQFSLTGFQWTNPTSHDSLICSVDTCLRVIILRFPKFNVTDYHNSDIAIKDFIPINSMRGNIIKETKKSLPCTKNFSNSAHFKSPTKTSCNSWQVKEFFHFLLINYGMVK